MSNLLTIGIQNQPKYVTNGLVLYVTGYNMNSYSGTGTTLYDISGNDNDGTMLGGVSILTPIPGTDIFHYAFYFDGSDDRITFSVLDPIADGLFADASSQWTVSSWFIAQNTSITNQGAITGKGGGTGNAATYVVWQQYGNLYTRLRGGTILNITNTLNNFGDVHEVVITWDGTTAKAYFNGQFSNNISVGTAAKQTNVFSIGATGGGNVTRFAGSIIDTKVYNRALTSNEITYNHDMMRTIIDAYN